MIPKCIIQAAGAALCLAVICGCGESGTESQQPVMTYRQSGCLEGTEVNYRSAHGQQDPYIVDVESSRCLDSLAGTFADSSGPGGTVRFEVSHDTVFVYHDSAFYNCCAKFAYQVEQNGYSLDFIEADTASTGCFCMCYFNLQTSAAGVAPGTYIARLWSENREYFIGEAEIIIPGAAVAWFETRCDTLIVYNNAYHANCGAVFVFDFSQQGSVLTFTQVDTSSLWMHCMCNFNLTAQVTGLADGEYTVRLWDDGNAHDMGGEADSLIAEAMVGISCP